MVSDNVCRIYLTLLAVLRKYVSYHNAVAAIWRAAKGTTRSDKHDRLWRKATRSFMLVQ
jgi:hypothetical protein